ncbi:hypothetical protein LRD18_06245 [Halorhodospira halochloris]|uniref:hypothetical protein n=1 Tax=Halorhodospira halochloris TaxID=1052 RepID=UPI001EE841C1|nr:hypothetical protein [Halorhodospira halochloris]MCG5530473.1 hypothetical protein [Halorhodospira halochloris]
MSSARVLRLYLPGLLGPLPGPLAEDGLPRLPALERWLARAVRDRVGRHPARYPDYRQGRQPENHSSGKCGGQANISAGQKSHPESLIGGFVPPCAGSAALAWLADGGNPGNCGWARVTPVHLSPEGRSARLVEVDLGGQEAEQLQAALNEHLEAVGLKLLISSAGRWFLRGDDLPPGRSDPRLLPGGRVDYLIPRSSANLSWSKLWTELEMSLFSHRLNIERQERGMLPVNSLWVWGEGICPQPEHLPWQRVASDSPEWRGWTLLAGGMAGESVEEALNCSTDSVLIHCSRLSEALSAEDWPGWLKAVEFVEQSVIGPALDMLSVSKRRSRSWDKAELWVDADAPPIVITKSALWRFWLRPKSFQKYVAQQGG